MILQNEIRCNKCNYTIFSRHRHDYVTCECGAVSVDGGRSYLRRSHQSGATYTDLSVEIPDAAAHAALEALEWAKENNRNNLGILCAVARALRDNGVALVVEQENA